MASLPIRFRWVSSWVTAALLFQALVLVLQTPMEIARTLPPVAAAEHHHAAPRHGDTKAADPLCSLCLGMQVAGHGVAPSTPALPVPVDLPASTETVVAIEAPSLDHPRPQNPRAPPIRI